MHSDVLNRQIWGRKGYCETYDLQFQRKGLESRKVNQKLLELLEFVREHFETEEIAAF